MSTNDLLAIIFFRNSQTGKRRLAKNLDLSSLRARRKFVKLQRTMLEHIVKQMKKLHFPVCVVTPNEYVINGWLANYEITALNDQGKGLVKAFQLIKSNEFTRKFTHWLICFADLPLLNAAALGDFLNYISFQADVGIVPAQPRSGNLRGTSLILLPSGTFVPIVGLDNSLTSVQMQCKRRELVPAVYWSEIGFDIDLLEDLETALLKRQTTQEFKTVVKELLQFRVRDD
jgi:2-phospho-L-lactate guanylyltransferase (CobY/MobA/RfbA family)